MEITKNNFEEFLKEFQLNLPKVQILSFYFIFNQCEILSFDLEMTGISCPDQYFLDIPQDRYSKMK